MQQFQCCDAAEPITAPGFPHLILSVGDGNSASAAWKEQKNADESDGELLPDPRRFRQLSAQPSDAPPDHPRTPLLSDRALADLGLYRNDIHAFARDASRVPGAESVISAVAADLKALVGFSAADASASASW
jgi:hypothetical protein